MYEEFEKKGYAPVKKNSPRKGRNTFKFGTFAGKMEAVQDLMDEAFKKAEEAERKCRIIYFPFARLEKIFKPTER
jgi:hypothetical protein